MTLITYLRNSYSRKLMSNLLRVAMLLIALILLMGCSKSNPVEPTPGDEFEIKKLVPSTATPGTVVRAECPAITSQSQNVSLVMELYSPFELFEPKITAIHDGVISFIVPDIDPGIYPVLIIHDGQRGDPAALTVVNSIDKELRDLLDVMPTDVGTYSITKFSAPAYGFEPTSWEWYFGDGATPSSSNEAEPVVMAGEIGTYNCYVVATTENEIYEKQFTLSVGPRDTQDTIMKSNVVLLEPNIVQIVDITDTSVKLSGSIPSLEIGNIIVSTEGIGLARRIESMQSIGGTMLLDTSYVAIEEIFERVDVHLNEQFGYDDIWKVDILHDGVTFEKGESVTRESNYSREADASIHLHTIRMNYYLPIGENIKIEGHNDYFINLEFDLQVGTNIYDVRTLGRVEHFKFAPSLDGTHDISLMFYGDHEFLKWERDLARIWLQPIPIGKIVFLPSVTVSTVFTITGEVGIKMTTSLESHVEAGIRYLPRTGWSYYDDYYLDIQDQDSAPSIIGYATGTAAWDIIQSSLKLYVYGLAGPFLALGCPKLWFEAGIDHTLSKVDLTLDGGVSATIGAKFEIPLPIVGWITIAEKVYPDIISVRFPLDKWTLDLPDIIPDDSTIDIPDIDIEDFPLVKLTVSVADDKGSVLKDLSKRNFYVYEDGSKVDLIDVKFEDAVGGDRGFSTFLVIDESGSLGQSGFQSEIDAAIEFVQLMRPIDRAGIIFFSDNAYLYEGLTSDRDHLIQRLEKKPYLGGWTNIREGVMLALEHLVGETGLKSIVLLTDGRHNRGPLNLQTMIDTANQQMVTVYTIGAGSGIDESMLTKLAHDTGGRYYAVELADLKEVFLTVIDVFQNVYVLEYQSGIAKGITRTARVEVTDGLRIICGAEQTFTP